MSDTVHLRYRSIMDLVNKAKVDYKGKQPASVYNRLSSMRDLAEKARKKGDEETEYIMLRRWLDSVEWLSKSIHSMNSRINQIDDVKKTLTDLERKLGAKYKQYSKEKTLRKTGSSEQMDVDVYTETGRDSLVPMIDGPIKLPETPTKDPLTDNEEFMTCEHLFQTLQKLNTRNRCLIIDIRPKSEYDMSHILTDRCINIPENEIKSGMLPIHFDRYLRKNRTALALFDRRGSRFTDVIVLVDRTGTTKSLLPNSHASILKRSLESDCGVRYKKILVLKGGYLQWVTRYPAGTTNPTIAESTMCEASDEIMEDIECPDWLHSDDNDSMIQTPENKLPNVNLADKRKPDTSVDKFLFKVPNSERNTNTSTHARNMSNNSIGTMPVPQRNTIGSQHGKDSPIKLPEDGPIKLPETPTKDPLTDNEDFVTCDQLFQTLQKSNTQSRCLIIDVRPKSEYDVSQILSDRCINIPESEIKRGILPAHFERYLSKDKRSSLLFQRRGSSYNDLIVLLDWNATSESLMPTSHVSILKRILEEWDPGVRYKKILILEGGYREWLTRYPAFTTNPKVVEPTMPDAAVEVLENIEYPEFLHFDDEDSMIKTRQKKLPNINLANKSEEILKPDVTMDKVRFKVPSSEMSSTTSIHVRHMTNNSIGSTSVAEPMDVDSNEINIIGPQHENNLFKSQNHRTTIVTKPMDIPAKPTIDRSSKPLSLKPSPSEAEIVLKIMRELSELAKNKEKLESEILEQERSLHVQQGLKYKDAIEEEYIHHNLKSLYAKLDEGQKAYLKIEEELSKYKNDMTSIKFTSVEKEEKDKIGWNLSLAKLRLKHLLEQRKELKNKPAQDEDENDVKETRESNTIHKEPLKGDSTAVNPGLERSYSSPNLFELGGHKAPRVDRSSKPQISTHNRNGSIGNDNVKISHLSWANREERMTPVHGTVHPGITGLKNLGNSCYMNSIIQCLSNTTHLAKYFTDNLYIDDLNTSNESSTQGLVVEEVAQVIKALWRGQYKSISPHDLKVAVGQYKLQFESYEQQDSHEFLTFLLDWMHNDLKKEYKLTHELSVAEKAWDKDMRSHKSIISDLFFGQLRSTITCSTCKQSSTTYETFNSLTTSLPHASRCTLNDCIQKFVTGQKVLGWKCPKCQIQREATKKFDFVKLAPIIVVHLNRFADSGGWLEKRNTAVEFPLTGFNLKPYLVSDSNTTTVSSLRSYNYSLYAMSNHYGTMEGGHYTAFCKNAAQNKWYKYDDQTVTEVNSNQVKSQTNTAYLLFYTSFSSNII